MKMCLQFIGGIQVEHHLGQDFYQLREELCSQGRLFEDPKFPAINASLFFSKPPAKRIEWKRPYVTYYFLR